jgi:hypothetical protein
MPAGAASLSLSVTTFTGLGSSDDGDLYTIQPAMLEQGSQADTSNEGTQWFAAQAPTENGLALLAMTGTSRLGKSGQPPTLHKTFVPCNSVRWETPNGQVTTASGGLLNIPGFTLEQLVRSRLPCMLGLQLPLSDI